MRDEDIKYIHELQKRVQELDELVMAYQTELSIKDNANKRINKKNKRYREVLNRIRITTKEETTHRWVHRALEGEE